MIMKLHLSISTRQRLAPSKDIYVKSWKYILINSIVDITLNVIRNKSSIIYIPGS